MPAIEVSGLKVSYGDHVAVRDVGFRAIAGEVTALLGPNGAGKTTTVETLEGFRATDAGQIAVLGCDPRSELPRLASRLGVMLQEGGVHSGIRAGEALALQAAYFDQPRDPDQLLARVGLAGRSKASWRQLSGGEQRRLTLALALVGRPEVAFLDEPTAGLDTEGRQLVRSLVRELADTGCCVLMTSHDLAEVEMVADHIVVVADGNTVAEGSIDEIAQRAGPPSIHFSTDPGLDTKALSTHLGGTVTSGNPGSYRVDGASGAHSVAALTAWLADRGHELIEIRTRATLEQLLEEITTKDGRR